MPRIVKCNGIVTFELQISSLLQAEATPVATSCACNADAAPVAKLPPLDDWQFIRDLPNDYFLDMPINSATDVLQ